MLQSKSKPQTDKIAHRARMAAKRAARPMRPGFTPSRNARIDAAMQLALVEISLTHPWLTLGEQQEAAVRRVASGLPAAPMVWRPRRRPSKQDSGARFYWAADESPFS